MKDGVWLAVIAVIFVLSCALAWTVMKGGGEEAVITVDGRELYRLPLSEERVIELECGNTVEISGGSVRVLWADCPDQVCVNMGPISDGTSPIVCLPHKLAVTVEGADGDTDINVK